MTQLVRTSEESIGTSAVGRSLLHSSMPPQDSAEYDALRATIRERGTARTWVFVAGLTAWAGLALGASALGVAPLLSVLPLIVLAGSFEAVFALHVSVERIGRYLQVFHADGWEDAAMSFGVPLAGLGVDPLFTSLFAAAALCNFVPVLEAGPVPAEWVGIGGVHLLFLFRLVLARRVSSRQRSADLARFQQLKDARTRRP